jgi:SAM-dependent methyltransferase
MSPYSHAERLQKRHYDSLASSYAAHYGDAWSQAYRRIFINQPMLGDVSLEGCEVLEAMCGSGETTEYLLQRGACVTGLDISEKEITHFRERFPNCTARCGSILSTGLPDSSFDTVVVVGGLHHLHPDACQAVHEIWRILKPGGIFCFCEPHRDSLPDVARRVWYRRDPLFAENEAAIDLALLKRMFRNKFEFSAEVYGGNLAYLFVLNSLILRVPLSIKGLYSNALIRTELLLRHVQGRRFSCFVVGRWRKRLAADGSHRS